MEINMGNVICCIPADKNGNKLWIKDLQEKDGGIFVKYKSTFNDMPFMETEIFLVDGDTNLVITGNDGTVLYRFHSSWANRLMS